MVHQLGFLVPVAGGDNIPLVKDTILIGRRPDCDIRINAENVSGKHAELQFRRGKWYIVDLQSKNGTKVEGTKITRRKSLAGGELIAIARKHLFRLDLRGLSMTMPASLPEDLEDEILDEAPEISNADLGILADDEDDNLFRRSLLEKAGLEKSKLDEFDDKAKDKSGKPKVEKDEVDSLDDLDDLIDSKPKKPKK